MPKLIWSSPQVVMSRRRVCKLGRLYFLLFIFTLKVGKSYENSVNHGGNTSPNPMTKSTVIRKLLSAYFQKILFPI